jgi:hypothetical protein
VVVSSKYSSPFQLSEEAETIVRDLVEQIEVPL